ncbi:MAG: zinc ABC transporter substrate-binding protein [Candidatus Aminicenantes bacterium]|nr:zinc ABC transporter substrate-binding protein [Candidatus Aminicenantes bacterium]
MAVFLILQGVSLFAEKIRIVTSIFPLKEFAGAVAGDRGEVSLLLKPGAEIHTWKPKPSDMIKLSKADLFIYIGADLEPWISDIFKSFKKHNIKILEASQGLELYLEGHEHRTDRNSDHRHGFMDPHIWFDFQYDQIIIAKITDILSEMDPQNKLHYQKNALSYQKKLQKLDIQYMAGLKDCDQKIIVLGGHNAFGYMARRYNLKLISLYGLSPNARPGPKQIAEIVDMAKKNNIKTIFYETFVNDQLTQVLAREIGAVTMALNTGANLTMDQFRAGTSFLQLMEINLENLKHGLSCR